MFIYLLIFISIYSSIVHFSHRLQIHRKCKLFILIADQRFLTLSKCHKFVNVPTCVCEHVLMSEYNKPAFCVYIWVPFFILFASLDDDGKMIPDNKNYKDVHRTCTSSLLVLWTAGQLLGWNVFKLYLYVPTSWKLCWPQEVQLLLEYSSW